MFYNIVSRLGIEPGTSLFRVYFLALFRLATTGFNVIKLFTAVSYDFS
jgi:hypothetical protein